MLQADPHVELAGEDGVADREAPQHAGITGLGVVVRQLAHRTGRLRQGGFVVEVGQCDRRGPHQRAVARRAASDSVQLGRFRARCLRGDAVSACAAENRPRLHTNIFGVLGPLVPPPDQGVERLFVTKVGPSGGHLSDGDGHRRVVGPFAGLPAEAAAPHHRHLEIRAAGRPELIRSTQGITGGGAQQHSDGPINLCGSQCHEIASPFTHRQWA